MALLNKRSLGTESGKLRRLARQVERDGGNPTNILNAAAEAKLGEGSAVTKAEDNSAREEYSRRLQRGQNAIATRSLFGQGRASTPTPTSGATPPLVTRPAAAPSAPAPVSKIDGVPASEALNRPPQVAPSFGRGVAEKNLAEKGLDGAVADYQRRRDAVVPPPDNSPGNMAEAKERDASRYTLSPLQQSIEAAKARREQSSVGAAPEPAVTPPPAEAPPIIAEVSEPVVAPKPQAPQTLGGAISRDLDSVRRTLGRGGDSIAEGARSMSRTIAKARDGAADGAADLATAPARAAASVVPGETGEVIRRGVQNANRSLRKTSRSILSNLRPPTFIP